MKISLNLLDTNKEIQDNILFILRDVMNQAFRKIIGPTKIRIKDLIKKALESEPEYQSLISGQLKYEMGIPAAQQVNNIISLWIDNITVNYGGIKISGNSGLSGSLSINMIKDSYDDVLANDSAIVIDSLSGAALPWLEWLLLYGGKIVVRDYRVKFGSNRRSRTGMAIMVESKGSNWRVPAEFAGTSSNNWVTRALDKIDDQILDVLEQELEKAI